MLQKENEDLQLENQALQNERDLLKRKVEEDKINIVEGLQEELADLHKKYEALRRETGEPSAPVVVKGSSFERQDSKEVGLILFLSLGWSIFEDGFSNLRDVQIRVGGLNDVGCANYTVKDIMHRAHTITWKTPILLGILCFRTI